MDGSGVIIREDQELSQCGFSAVSVNTNDMGRTVDDSENPDTPVTCGCKNASNPFHKCSSQCAEFGCDEVCMRRKPEQKTVMGTPVQAVYGPLHGNNQTTPRAELMAILVAVCFGRSPQRIISDHLNHVVYLRDWMIHGKTEFLNPQTP